MARKTSFVKRKGKIHPKTFLKGLLAGSLRGVDITLEGMLEQSGNEASKVALHNRFNAEAVLFLEEVLKCVIQRLERKIRGEYRRALGQFGQVFIYDSSAWEVSPRLSSVFPGSGGCSSEAGCKLQLEYELKTGRISGHSFSSAIVTDHSFWDQMIESATAESLNLFDLGYFGYELLEEIDNNGAYFLCRLRSNATLIDERGKRIVLAKVLRNARKRGATKLEFLADINDNGLRARIIATRLPAAVRRERIKKLKRNKQKKGQFVSDECREVSGWSVHATNAHETILPSRLAAEIYRLRWSIELLFRQLKSTLKLDHGTHANRHRLHCEVLARLIVATIAAAIHGSCQSESFYNRKQEISLQKVFQLFQRQTDSFLDAFFRNISDVKAFFRHLEQSIFRWCKKDLSSVKPSTFQRILSAGTQRMELGAGA